MRKYFSLVMAAVICICTFPLIYVQAEQTYADSSSYEDMVYKTFEHIGFGYMLKQEDSLTRAEFAQLIAAVLQLKQSVSEEAVFLDVPGRYAYSVSINAVAEAGIMFAKEQDMFKPNDSLTEIEAVAAMVNIIGFGERVRLRGSSAANYLSEAKSRGITKNISIVQNADISWQKLLTLLYNTMNAGTMQMAAAGGYIEYAFDEEQSKFYQLYNIRSGKGIVMADRYTSLTDERSGGNETIVVSENGNEIKMSYDEQSFGDYLGYEIDFSYEVNEKDDKYKLIAIAPTDKNSVVTVKSNDIESVKDGIIYYLDADNRRKYITVRRDTDIIYNGKAFMYADDDLLKPDNGRISLLDNGKQEILFIEDYMTAVVRSVDKENGIINLDQTPFGFSKRRSIRGEELPAFIDISDSALSSIYANGKQVGIGLIEQGNVISVMQSDARSGEIITKIILSSKTLEGTVTSVQASENYSSIDEKYSQEIISVDGVDYVVAGDVMLSAQTGRSYEFLLDAFGAIAGWKTNRSSQEYAYLINARTYCEEENTLVLKLLLESGEIIDEIITQRLYVDNFRYDISSEVHTQQLLDRLYKASREIGLVGGYAQIIRVYRDNDGELSRIDTVLNRDGVIDTDIKSDGLKIGRGNTASNLVYKSASGVFGGMVCTDENTIVFSVPTDTSIITDCDNQYYVSDRKVFGNDTRYNVIGFDCNRVDTASVIVSYNAGGVIKESGVYIISKINKNVWSNSREKAVTRLEGYNANGAKKIIEAEPSDVPNWVSKGDVLNLSISYGDEIKKCAKIFDVEENIEYTTQLPCSTANSTYESVARLVYGYIQNYDQNHIKLSYGDSSEVYYIGSATIFKFRDDEVEFADVNDFIAADDNGAGYSKAVIYAKSGVARSVYIY